MISARSAWVRLRHDELLYSGIARLSHYLDVPQRGRLHEAILGGDVSIFDDLPVGLDRFVAKQVCGLADLHGAAHEWTLFPYYAHYVGPGLAKTALRRMAGTGTWPHEALGCGALPPDRLRFCCSCRSDMLEQHGEAWWRRTHQLPSSLVCPDHGEPLRVSELTRERRRSGYVRATPEECPDGAPVLADADDRKIVAKLLLLARAGDLLLDEEVDEHPDDRRERYLRQLSRFKLLNRAGEANLPAIAEAMAVRWGETLCMWPELVRDGRCRQAWIGTLLLGDHGSPPLHHLLVEGLLIFLARWR